MRFAIVSGADVKCTFVKTEKFPKKYGWNQAANVQILFEDDRARLGYPLYMETMNKKGTCVLKIKCYIYNHSLSYHNSTSNHILSHNLTTAQGIVAATTLATESTANGEPFLIHKL